MNQVTSQRLMAIFIGFIMVASIMGFAMMSNAPQEQPTVEVPDVMNRELAPEEKISILRGNRVLIEYFHNESCIECLGRETLYMEFVKSMEFEGYLALSYGSSENLTVDQMINLDGTQIDLSGMNTTADLRNLFCEVGFLKPNICILQELD